MFKLFFLFFFGVNAKGKGCFSREDSLDLEMVGMYEGLVVYVQEGWNPFEMNTTKTAWELNGRKVTTYRRDAIVIAMGVGRRDRRVKGRRSSNLDQRPRE